MAEGKSGSPSIHFRGASGLIIALRLLIDTILSAGCRTVSWRYTLRAFWLLVGMVLSVGCSNSTPSQSPPSQADPVQQMQDAMRASDWERADTFARDVLIANPQNPDLITDVAKVAAFCDRKREAAHLLVEAVEVSDFRQSSRVDFAVQGLIDVGEIYPAMDLLERSLVVDPQNVQHRRMLVGFLAETQRLDRVKPHLQKLIEDRGFDLQLLAALTETSVRRFSSKTALNLMKRNPTDHRVRLATAFEQFEKHDVAGAEIVLDDILANHPDFGPAYAMYGQVLIEQGRLDQIAKWSQRAPESSADYADHWLTLGDWSSEQNHYAQATRAYLEAARRDSNSTTAWTRLIRSAKQLRHSDSPFADMASDEWLAQLELRLSGLMEFRQRYDQFETSDKKSQRYATEVAKSLLAVGRNWEAEAWSAVATTLPDDPSSELRAVRTEVLRSLRIDNAWLSKASRAVLENDLATNLPLPSISNDSLPASKPILKPLIAATDHLRMREESDAWGLGKIGANNNPDDAGLAPLTRSTAAGGGAIDYDLDGQPDLVVMGAAGTMLQQDSLPNQLLRNLGTQFTSVTKPANINDYGFGQGVAVGDINEDGFPDLFFANLGKNRLFGNNGDGTFSDWTSRLQDGGAQDWTTCGSFVDMNQDGLSDLLTINYCDTAAPIDQGCANEAGILGPCPPLEFPAYRDQFFYSSTDGQLADVTSQWKRPASPGRGLGLVTGAIDGQGQCVYIANDMSANEFYNHAGSNNQLIESAVPRGLAVDGRTLVQASMGIATSDFDLDGDLDLYVTGFGGEYNILYEQVAPGLWEDSTSRLGLVRPTLDVLGFGTEAIDLDDDGIDEIIVTNGHIGDFHGVDALPYEQPLQIFRRDPSGRFSLLEDDGWGNYFDTLHVGRALWTLDVNSDGRNDVIITHAHEGVRLLVNRGDDRHNRIAFRLVGTNTSRDAIGAIVHFKCDDQPRFLWSLSGDGYMCSNERTLRKGLGKAEHVTDLTVTWPDGSIDQFGSLKSGAEYILVQGAAQAFRLRKFSP